ncbi:acylphosphatase [Chungangia koreensis]|uniref:acylphosphatase n=1 Tax=Chungangia koreensis TaxID=752657 RepID=A0ABV8X4N9_9LACT
MNSLKKLRDSYIIWHANRIKFPDFAQSPVVRKNITFSGKVQNVGFRLELWRLAQRLNLKGWVKNSDDGSVIAELQGEESKIDFLIKSMQSLKRATVNEPHIVELPFSDEELDIKIIR